MRQKHQDGRVACLGAIVISMCVGAFAMCAGCETTEGAGRDLEKLGDNIEDAASDAKD